jgi:hypothetical protein
MKGNRTLTIVFLVAGCTLLVIALVVGIADNAPGIALLYLASLAGVLAFVHRWRTVRRFVLLAVASIVGVPVFALLHNVFYALSQSASDIVPLSQALKVLDAVSFLVALIVCPAGILVGVVGAVLAYVRDKRGRA